MINLLDAFIVDKVRLYNGVAGYGSVIVSKFEFWEGYQWIVKEINIFDYTVTIECIRIGPNPRSTYVGNLSTQKIETIEGWALISESNQSV